MKVQANSSRNHGNMVVPSVKVVNLCSRVERMATELDLLVARGHAKTTWCVMLRMKLAALTVELVWEDWLERMRCTR